MKFFWIIFLYSVSFSQLFSADVPGSRGFPGSGTGPTFPTTPRAPVGGGGFNSFQDLLSAIYNLVSYLIPTVFALALLFFLWGVSKVVRGQGDEKAIEGGKRVMIWGLLALFVMSSIWGIVAFLKTDLIGLG